MPQLTDRDAIRAVLHADRIWAAYALGDLAPGFFEHSTWYGVPNDPTALALVLRLFDSPVVFLTGASGSVRFLLDEVGTLPRIFFLARPDAMPVLRERYRIEKVETMWRMRLEPAEFRPVSSVAVEQLGPADLDALQTLFADGEATNESPDFFSPGMLEKGIYFGIREANALAAAAGTHLFEPSEGIGAIGNVYTRRDRRGRGLASQATSAVAAELLSRNLRTIVLNVNKDNLPAQRVYRRLGFRPHCLYEEGIAIGK